MPKQTFLEKFAEKIDRIDKGEILSFVVTQAREKGFLEDILNSLNDGIMVLDSAGIIQFINPAARELVGAGDTEGMVGKPFERHVRDARLFEFIGKNDAQNSQLVNREFEIDFPRKLFLSVSLLPLLDEENLVYGIAVIMRDMTEKRRVEGRMAQSERLGALSVLAAGLAHEIGNPLNSLHIHAQLIDREFAKLKTGKKKLADLIRIVSDEIKRIDDIARNFLQAIRPLKTRFEEEDVNRVIEKTIKVIMPEMTAAGILAERAYADSLPLTLLDKSQLKQAFLNIIKNSMQAMPSGGAIKVATSAHGDIIKIVFEDTGHGIAPENMSRIFDPYFTTRKDGSGLGLMMTHRIIKEHGGDIEVKSQSGKGTTFTVTIPVRTLTPKMLPKV